MVTWREDGVRGSGGGGGAAAAAGDMAGLIVAPRVQVDSIVFVNCVCDHGVMVKYRVWAVEQLGL